MIYHQLPDQCSWCWKKMVEVRDLRTRGCVDSKWLGTKDGRYTIASGYSWLLNAQARYDMSKMVWLFLNMLSSLGWLVKAGYSQWIVLIHGLYGLGMESVLCAQQRLNLISTYSFSAHTINTCWGWQVDGLACRMFQVHSRLEGIRWSIWQEGILGSIRYGMLASLLWYIISGLRGMRTDTLHQP